MTDTRYPNQALNDRDSTEHVARTIDELCKAHGLAAMYFISAPTHATHALRFETAPWCRVEMVEFPDGSFKGFHVKSKLADYMTGGFNEADARVLQQRDMEYTISMLDHFGGIGGQVSMIALEALKLLTERFGAQTTSHRVGDAGGKA